MNKHRWFEVIAAWSLGKTIQWRLATGAMEDWADVKYNPRWDDDTLEFRVKPEPPAMVVREMFIEAYPTLDNAYNAPNVRFTFEPVSLELVAIEKIPEIERYQKRVGTVTIVSAVARP